MTTQCASRSGRLQRWFAVGALLALCSCGAEGETTSGKKQNQGTTQTAPKSTALRTLQEAIDAGQWKVALDNDSALSATAATIKSTWQHAGVIEDDAGGRLLWAEYASDPEADRNKVQVVFKFCPKAATDGQATACMVGTGDHGSMNVTLQASGNTLDWLDIGAPVLRKEAIKGQGASNPTVLKPGLGKSLILDPAVAKAQFASVHWAKRRLVIINAYGPQVGVHMTKTIKAAKDSAHFDEVTELQFARHIDVQRLLPSLSPLDVVVWLGAGVIETYKSGKPNKSVGMTVSRGIFGDAYFHREAMLATLAQPPLGGPGLVVLAGSDSLRDDSQSQTGIFADSLRAFPYRPVVGFDGLLDAQTADAASATLITSLTAGDSLEAAMSKASEIVANGKTNNLMEIEQRESWSLAKQSGDLLGKRSTKGQLALYMSINPPSCVDITSVSGICDAKSFEAGSAQGKGIDPTKLTSQHASFLCDVLWTGPYFSCTAKNAQTGADFTARGVVTGIDAQRQVAVYVTGSAGLKVKDLALAGIGTIEKADIGGGSTVLHFSGPAIASTYRNEDGYCCIAPKPQLSNFKGDPSTLKF